MKSQTNFIDLTQESDAPKKIKIQKTKKCRKTKKSKRTLKKKTKANVSPVSFLSSSDRDEDRMTDDLFLQLVKNPSCESFSEDHMNSIINFLTSFKHNGMKLGTKLSESFKKIYNSMQEEKDEDGEYKYYMESIYDCIHSEYPISSKRIEKDFDLNEMIGTFDFTSHLKYFELLDKEKLKVHLKKSMNHWVKESIRQACIFYDHYFFSMVCLWHHLDMINDQDTIDFHRRCIRYTLKTISKYPAIIAQAYTDFVHNNQTDHAMVTLDSDSDMDHELDVGLDEDDSDYEERKLEQASRILDDKKEIFEQVKGWNGIYPFCRFVDGNDSIDDVFDRIEYRSNYYLVDAMSAYRTSSSGLCF
jgi:hypothetical protein